MPKSVCILLLFHWIARGGRAQFFSLGVKEASDKAELSPQLMWAVNVKGLRTELFSGGARSLSLPPGYPEGSLRLVCVPKVSSLQKTGSEA